MEESFKKQVIYTCWHWSDSEARNIRSKFLFSFRTLLSHSINIDTVVLQM